MSTKPFPVSMIILIILVALAAVGCWLLAVTLTPLRREAPSPAITEYEDPARATLPEVATFLSTQISPNMAVPTGEISSVAVVPVSPAVVVSDTASVPRYIAHAMPHPDVPAGHVRLAIVLDDMGVDGPASREAITNLPAAITFAFLPYGRESRLLAERAHADGHEIMIHIPMEPLGSKNPGPQALRVDDLPVVVQAHLEHNVAALKDLAVGANNHMGSRFTQWPDGMRQVLGVLAREGLFFLDSVTTPHTAVRDAAAGLDLPLLRRDVFLDDTPTPEAIQEQLERAIGVARRNGQAIAIGHPHVATLAILEAQLPTLAGQGVTLVPITALLSIPDGRTTAP